MMTHEPSHLPAHVPLHATGKTYFNQEPQVWHVCQDHLCPPLLYSHVMDWQLKFTSAIIPIAFL